MQAVNVVEIRLLLVNEKYLNGTSNEQREALASKICRFLVMQDVMSIAFCLGKHEQTKYKLQKLERTSSTDHLILLTLDASIRRSVP